LIDATGVRSKWESLTINIVEEKSEETEDETSIVLPTIKYAFNSDFLGQKFANLLKSRFEKAQNQVIAEEEKVLVPPSAKVLTADSTGLVKVAFTNKMLISPELKSMDSNGKVTVSFESRRNLQIEASFDVLSVKVIPGEESQPQNLDFSWKLDSIDENGMAV